MERETGFDVEAFRKLVAQFDSSDARKAETAFRKAVLLCAENGLTLADVFAEAFGHTTAELEARNAALQERLDQREADGGKLADLLAQADEKIAALENGQTQERGEREAGFKAWFRHAWSFPQFRLLALTMMSMVEMVINAVDLTPIGPLLSLASLFVFVAWSIALCRKQGWGQMLLKWVVYYSVVVVGGLVLEGFDAFKPPAVLLVPLVAMVLTLSRLSERLGEMIRVKIWESNPVQVVRGWF